MKPIIYSSAAEVDQDQALREHPKAWAPYFDDFRKINLDPFPYAVVYEEKPENIRIIAIVDLRRQPGYWLKEN